MARWRCPECKREFGKVRQGHMCSPGMSLEEYFAEAKPWEEPIFNVVHDHLASLEGGDLIVDPIAMGIMFKNGPMICELRARTKWTALGFSLTRKLTSDRLSRKVIEYQNKSFHVINLHSADDVDDQVLGWLTEAYYVPMGGAPAGSDPMVPDDIDEDFWE
ncbi:MAG: hypothetical protein HKN24_12025 [Acidimicrobiales bacterium]|nr:hypothetical protein [Acidimicrobiales bacterium]